MKTSKKIPKSFFVFLIVSCFIWILITFSKEYKTVIEYEVDYQNIPQNKLLQETPIKKLEIAVKASGFRLLATKFIDKKINLEASSLSKKKGSQYFFLVKSQKLKIENQLVSGITIDEILTDTIYLNLGFLASKKVALKPNLDINYHIGYDLLNEVKVTPDSIIISGPENKISKITYLNLKKLKLSNVKANFTNEVLIAKPLNIENLKLSVHKAIIAAEVDKFTEGTIQVPFTIKNISSDTKLTILTEMVTVSFVVALSNFSKVSKESFIIECDFSMSETNNLSYLIPKVVLKPNFVKNVKIIPNKIDFLIRK